MCVCVCVCEGGGGGGGGGVGVGKNHRFAQPGKSQSYTLHAVHIHVVVIKCVKLIIL